MMIVHVHGFDWGVYAGRVMPAFERWLTNKDETAIYQLFERTSCNLEEQFLPDPMQRLRVWPRARTFVDALPRGPHSRREYTKLCSAEQFTALSDRYLHNHTPHLYQNSPAVRTVWGAILEEYCLPWQHASGQEQHPELVLGEADASEQTIRSELVSLLQAAGLPELAREVGEQTAEVERFEWDPAPGEESVADNDEEFDLYADEENADATKPKGIMIGNSANTLRLRGWLAGISLRAMVLFEYLACGRRRMPFGYEPGEPFGAYCGYLTPDEAWQLATCLHNVKPPNQFEAEEDNKKFTQQHPTRQEMLRLVDEVLPTNAHDLLKAVRRAALQGTGLICSLDA